MSGDADAGGDGPTPFLIERDDGLKHMSPTYARAFLNLVRAGDAVDRWLDADLRRREGLTVRAFEVLLHLAVFSEGGTMRMSRLAGQAPLSQSRVSRLVAELEREGYVTRSAAEDDSRGVMVTITQAGIAKYRQAQETHYAGLQERLFSRLTYDEVVQLGEITRKLLEPGAGSP